MKDLHSAGYLAGQLAALLVVYSAVNWEYLMEQGLAALRAVLMDARMAGLKEHELEILWGWWRAVQRGSRRVGLKDNSTGSTMVDPMDQQRAHSMDYTMAERTAEQTAAKKVVWTVLPMER